MKAAVVLCGLALVACGDIPKARTETEIRDMASAEATDVAVAAVSRVEDRTAELERKVRSLETERDRLQIENQMLRDDLDTLSSQVRTFQRIYDSHTH